MLKIVLNQKDRIGFGPFELDRPALVLTREGKALDTPKRSLALLARLLENPDRVVTKQELMDSVWGETHVSPTSLGEAMSRLRHSLGDNANHPVYIQTVRGRGYRFIGTRRGAGQLIRGRWSPAALAASLVLLITVGVLRSRAKEPESSFLVRLSENGEVTEVLPLPHLDIAALALAPDGRRLALAVESPTSTDIWVFDPAVESLVQISEGGQNMEIVWSPDGEYLVYATDVGGSFDLVRRRVDRRGPIETLLSAPGDQFPESYSSDGLTLIYSHTTETAGLDLATLSLDGQGKWTSRPLRATRAHEYLAASAPGNKALAFVSNESGRWDAYVQSLEPGAEPVRISDGGGVRDVFWSTDGKAIHYLEDGQLVSIPVGPGSLPKPGGRTRLRTPVHITRVEAAPGGGFIAAVS